MGGNVKECMECGGCGKVCWGVGQVTEDVGGAEKCGRVYEVIVEGVGKCVEVWGK